MVYVTGIFSYFDYKIVEIPYVEGHANLKRGDVVIFKGADEKEAAGEVEYVNRNAPDANLLYEKGVLLRKCTPNDIQKIDANKEREQEALDQCKEKVEKYGLDMQLVNASFSSDGSRLNFIFTSDNRVDFRELVQDLARVFQKQIRLQQIGPRDKARVIKGFGKCGRAVCCSSHLRKLDSVTMDSVRVQNMENKGSSKLSGLCGKLLCCLKYEADFYNELKKDLPEWGNEVETATTKGKVIGLDILNQKIKIVTANKEYLVIPVAEIKKINKPKKLGSKEKFEKEEFNII